MTSNCGDKEKKAEADFLLTIVIRVIQSKQFTQALMPNNYDITKKSTLPGFFLLYNSCSYYWFHDKCVYYTII